MQAAKPYTSDFDQAPVSAWGHAVAFGEIEDTPQAFAEIKTKLATPDGLTYRDFRRGLEPRFGLVWRDVALGYGALAALMAGALVLERAYPIAAYFAAIPLALLFGLALHHVGLFMHAGAHYGLARNRRLNDLLSNALFGVLFATHIQDYRVQHTAHHLHHGHEGDTENAYVAALNAKFFIGWLSGWRTVKKLLGIGAPAAAPAEGAGGRRWFRLVSLGVHALICVVLLVTGFIAAAFAWALAVGIFFPMISDMRLILEHRSADAEARMRDGAHGAYTRMFKGGLLSKVLGGAGFDRHMLHHWEPSAPYERLNDLEVYLRAAGLADLLDARTTTYSRAFWVIVRSSSAPHAAQATLPASESHVS